MKRKGKRQRDNCRRRLNAGLASCLCLFAYSAHATSINVDIGGFSGKPSDSYGAAAGQAGFWNEITYSATSYTGSLLDLSGAASGATLSISNLSSTGTGSNAPAADGALMNDLGRIAPSGVGNTALITISGLDAGTYDVFTYAWEAGLAATTKSTNINVNNIGSQLIAPTSNAFIGFLTGTTHAQHTVSIMTGDDIVISATTVDDIFDQGVVNGFQLVQQPIPIPATVWLLVTALGSIGYLRKMKAV